MDVKAKLSEVVGVTNFSDAPEQLQSYATDLSYSPAGVPNYVVKPANSKEVSAVVKFCNDKSIPVVPCSSKIHFYGATIPKEGGVVLDMSRMNKILEIDPDNRRVRFEAGVTWEKLTTELGKKGYRVIMPLTPPAERSVLTDFMEREEPTNQVYDYGEPLEAMEVVWPTGEIFRMGSASVNGYPESMSKGGNPSGQGLDFYRFFQCAQGTMGVVTWTNLKIESISTDALGFEVLHLVEYVAEMVKNGALKMKKPFDTHMTYHDSCSLSRLSEPWTPYEGKRGWMGCVEPRLKRRRGSNGVYAQPRDILKSIPSVDFVEMPRTRENAFCCGAGRGPREAFPDFARWAADHRLEEVREIGAETLVSSCPICKSNFTKAVKANGDDVQVLDISEVICASIDG